MAPIIAVDLDEVLGFFVEPLCKFHNEKYKTTLKISDFFSYTFSEVWGGTDAEATEKVAAFFKSPYFHSLPPIPQAQHTLGQLKQLGFDLAVVTSRQNFIQDETRSWLAKHYPDTFCDVLFGNHWAATGTKRSKADMCRDLNAVLLIDDSLSYTAEVAEAGMHALLFDLDGCWTWNQSDVPLPSRVTRVTSWPEVYSTIEKCSSQLLAKGKQCPSTEIQ